MEKQESHEKPDEEIRILHTGDWHLGYKLGPHSRRVDTAAALASLKEHAERERPDLIMHAGDLFHHEPPSAAAVADAVDALKSLARTAPIVLIRGNHDGAKLLSSMGKLAEERDPPRIRIITEPSAGTFRLRRRGGAEMILALAAVPWISKGRSSAAVWAGGGDGNDPAAHRRHTAETAHAMAKAAAAAGAKSIKTARKEHRKVLNRGGTAPVVLLMHAHIAGATAGDGENPTTMSPEYEVAAGSLPDEAVYTALGHIHDRQRMLKSVMVDGKRGPERPPAVYCGSLTRMTFGERSGGKTAELVTISENETGGGWKAADRRLELAEGRKLIRYEGGWDGLLETARAGGLRNAIVKPTIETEQPVFDIAGALLDIEPTVLLHDPLNPGTNPEGGGPGDPLDFKEVKEAGIEELYREWRAERAGAERGGDEAAVSLFAEALAAVREPVEDPFGLKAAEAEFERILGALGRRTADGRNGGGGR